MTQNTSELIQAHQPCEECGSSDALSIYSDGHTHCFSCGATKHPKGGKPTGIQNDVNQPPARKGLLQGRHHEIKSRGLSMDTVVKTDYQVTRGVDGDIIQIANYYSDSGEVIAQKLRSPQKDFTWTGNPAMAGLYGKHLWKGHSNKQLIITEGEIDMLSVFQVTLGKMPVVSLQNGAQSAERSFKKDIEWLNTFEKVILCFDNDEPGREAAKKTALMLAPGTAHICELPKKDANDMLTSGLQIELLAAIKNAAKYVPNGMLHGTALSARARKAPSAPIAHYPWKHLDNMTGGMRAGELIVVTGGIGIGKTSIMSEFSYSLAVNQRLPVGMLMLEETPERTVHRLWGHHLKMPLQINLGMATDEQLDEAAAATTDMGNIVIYEQQGDTSIESMMSRVRYLVHHFGIKILVIDNLTALVASAGSSGDDERGIIDKFMRQLFTFTLEMRIVTLLGVHLKRGNESKGHENGGEVSLSQLRGSQAIASNVDTSIALERNQQAEDVSESCRARVRVLKNRHGMRTGVSGEVEFDISTGQYSEVLNSESLSTPFTATTTNSQPKTQPKPKTSIQPTFGGILDDGTTDF